MKRLYIKIVHKYVKVWVKKRGTSKELKRERERDKECVCVSVCVRERKREREGRVSLKRIIQQQIGWHAFADFFLFFYFF